MVVAIGNLASFHSGNDKTIGKAYRPKATLTIHDRMEKMDNLLMFSLEKERHSC